MSSYDGHINRNIRLAMSLIEISKPYIEVESITNINDYEIEVIWKVNGCYQINEARVRINNEIVSLLNSDGFCNYLLNEND